MGDNMQMFNRAVGHHQTVLKIEPLLVAFRAINDLLDQSGILRMDPPENQGSEGLTVLSYPKILKLSSDQKISPLETCQPKLPV